MVSISTGGSDLVTGQLFQGLDEMHRERLQNVLAFAEAYYASKIISTGQSSLAFSVGAADTLAAMNADFETRAAALLFSIAVEDAQQIDTIGERYGPDIEELVSGVRKLMRVHSYQNAMAQASAVARTRQTGAQADAQVETLRKMLLAMAGDVRVVLIRLASRLVALRYFADNRIEDDFSVLYARDTLSLYTPLANRLGVWQLKWELEDLSFRFIDPETYKRIAKMLEERRTERESFVAASISRLRKELEEAGISAEVTGRPKHIYSIWNKMRGKELNFSELYDVRAFRVVVEDIKTCYEVLGIVHNIWTPIPKEFDDYISRPKSNGYQSLHTVVTAEDQRALEVQIRTRAMQNFAEYGVAAHWRYKETGTSNFSAQKYDEKISWLRQLLAWKTEVSIGAATATAPPVLASGSLSAAPPAGAVDVTSATSAASAVSAGNSPNSEHQESWREGVKNAALDEHIYLLTPAAKVIELPQGSTPIDFAYYLHTDVGHRCRGARIDGVMMPLNTPLKNGQTVEIITAKNGSHSTGPSRDWLMPGYVASSRVRSKVRAWFNAIEQQETLSNGRAILDKTLQREGRTAVNLEDLATRLGFARLDDLLLALGKDIFSLRIVEQALRDDTYNPQQAEEEVELDEATLTRKSKASSVMRGANSGVLVVGTDGLMTQLARCCKPAPPDPIVGFTTRGKGISIHRRGCRNFEEMRRRSPERIIETTWGHPESETVYPVDIFILAADRQGLLRDISDAFLREKINVIGLSTQTMKGHARMAFTVEISSTAQLQRALAVIGEVRGVLDAKRK